MIGHPSGKFSVEQRRRGEIHKATALL